MKNFQNLIEIENNFQSVVKEIGGIQNYNGILNGIDIACRKIKDLTLSTQNAFGIFPKALNEKINILKGLSARLDVIRCLYLENEKNIAEEKSGIILPPQKELITDSTSTNTIYNQFSRGSELQQKNSITVDAVTKKELQEALSELKEDGNWDYSKLNLTDSKLYKKLKGQLLFGDYKTAIKNQIEKIDKELTKLKSTGFKHSEETNLNIYDTETTGKILALETAKLRREALTDFLIRPELDKNLEKSNILVQPTPEDNIFFTIDKSFEPTQNEITQMLNSNAGYKNILEKLFPNGLPVYTVPGYTLERLGDMVGGESLPKNPDLGAWLNSYNLSKKYDYMSSLERTTANMRNVTQFGPSVLKGNEDRARALAHEIAHVISYRIIQNERQSASESESLNSKHSILTPGEINFMEVWRGLRANAIQKLNGNEINYRLNRDMEEFDKQNLMDYVEYEMIAEDIRMAILGDVIPASSRMTGIYDQTESGKEELKSVIHYLKSYLLENKKTIDIIYEIYK